MRARLRVREIIVASIYLIQVTVSELPVYSFQLEIDPG
jgi:hypothetical protein